MKVIASRSSNIPVIDLFAGAGGLSLGASQAGADVRLLVDLDDASCESVRRNAVHRRGFVLDADVADLSGADLRSLASLSRADPLVVIGGAPCQPFSKAAYWTDPGEDAAFRRARTRGEALPRPRPIETAREDQRRDLVMQFLRLVAETRADAFVFENVPSITHPRNRSVLEGFLSTANALGFHVNWFRANAAEYGVAQLRDRVFVLGSRRSAPSPPTPTHTRYPDSAPDRLPMVTAGEALAGFDDPRLHEPEELVEGKWARHLREVPPGWNYKHHTAWAGHKDPTFEAETRFWNFLLKLSPGRPSWTIAASPGPWTGPFHWTSRRLRIPELAALQGFPPGYEFYGKRRERVRQIGNAVPVPMARKVVEQVLETLSPGARLQKAG